MKSNATLLTLLTISDIKEDKVFFGYMKELEEIAPVKPHLYTGKGKNGDAIFLWGGKKGQSNPETKPSGHSDIELYNVLERLGNPHEIYRDVVSEFKNKMAINSTIT